MNTALVRGGMTLMFLAFLADPARPEAPPPALQELPAEAWDYAKARHLLFRAGLGGPAAEVEQLKALGLRQAVERLVDYQRLPFDLPPPVMEKIEITDEALRKLTPEERQKVLQQRRQQDQRYFQQVRDWWIRRLVESPRPLEEKLVLFWHGHFAAEYRTVRNSPALLRQNQLFREQAAGNFGKLLKGIVHDPAMLRYLDNNTNVKGRPNENLAREIMELFAMGEGQGYSEQDIKEGARALTGYTFDRETLAFRFQRPAHDPGPKTIFGRTGPFDGDQFVDLILEQPATPRFIARKLFVFFVHDDPDAAVVEHLAQVLKGADYELAPVLRTLFLSREFYGPKAVGTHIKSPVEHVAGTLRILKVEGYEPAALAQALRTMGQELFEPPNVKGWEGGRTWINSNTLFARENFAALLAARGLDLPAGRPAKDRPPAKLAGKGPDRPPGAAGRFDLAAILREAKAETAEEVVDYLARLLLNVPLAEAKRAELVRFLGPLPPAAEWQARARELNARFGGLLVLILSLPEYQLT